MCDASPSSSEALEEESLKAARPRLSKATVAAALAANDEPDDICAPTEILDGFLFLGDADNASSLRQLAQFQITHVLNVTTNEELGVHQGISRCFLYARDWEDEQIARLFPSACEFMETARVAGGRVLVHCLAGRSRSASLVLAYLMQHLRMSLSDAFFLVKRRRPIVLPNVGFWEQLMTEELRLFGRNSAVPENYVRILECRRSKPELSPSTLFASYLSMDGAGEQLRLFLESWPEAWPASKVVEEVLLAGIEHLHAEARRKAIRLVAELLEYGRFTRHEVREALQLFWRKDLEDLRIDNPRVDEYLSEMSEEAERLGLLPSDAD